MPGSAQLAEILERLDGRGYKAYRDIEGPWSYAEFTLFVDRVQADPFAAPSKLRIRLDLDLASFPETLRGSRVREIAARVWLAQRFRETIRLVAPRRSGTGKGGLVTIDAGGPAILERTAVVFGEDWVEARIEVGLPAAGRRALGREAAALLTEVLPEILTRAWIDRGNAVDDAFLDFVNCADNQESIRSRLEDKGLIAFVGEGAVLPRESGASERPMSKGDALPFDVPPAFRVSFDVPHANAGAPGSIWHGMGIPRGVVLFVGGGYHGKSTVLRAIESAVVSHVPGDGRETVVADPRLVKIRAEEGRSVTAVDIQCFIDGLPTRPGESAPRDTSAFSSEDASGSTSQAANISEAIEAGAVGLLLDEDTSATNFMIRDARMKALIHPDDEPITPFVERVRDLYDQHGISTLLVMGGSGDYFAVADAVIEMKNYRPVDATARAHAIASANTESQTGSVKLALRRPKERAPLARSFDARRGRRDVKFSSRACEEIVYGTTEIDLRSIEQLFDPSQTRAIAAALHLIALQHADGERPLREILDRVEDHLDTQGLDAMGPSARGGRHPGALARPRRFEIAAALNRMRTLSIVRVESQNENGGEGR